MGLNQEGKIEVLEHHQRLIQQYHNDILNISAARESVDSKTIPTILEATVSGEPSYPILKNDEQQRERFVNAFAKAIVAVNSGNAVIVQDSSAYKPHTPDEICSSCGNLYENMKGVFCRLRIKKIAKRLSK